MIDTCDLYLVAVDVVRQYYDWPDGSGGSLGDVGFRRRLTHVWNTPGGIYGVMGLAYEPFMIPSGNAEHFIFLLSTWAANMY